MEASAEPDAGDIPSCKGCRKRKLKCSREQPSCSHCKRLEAPCEYNLTKNKPGLKLGAVGSLSRRVEVLEEALLKSQEQNHQHQSGALPSMGHSSPNDIGTILSTLARELHELNSRTTTNNNNNYYRPATQSQPTSPDVDVAVVSPATSHASTRRAIDGVQVVAHPHDQPRKRRRVDSCGNPNIGLSYPLEDLENTSAQTTTLPPPDLLEDVITAYFNLVQPWIPILHETQFRRRVHDAETLPQLVVVLHAMVVAALRFVDADADADANGTRQSLSTAQLEQMTSRSRNVVLLNAMDKLSVENLQALLIVAFTDIGNGEASKAWSIVGSLTRTVEYQQLSVEADPDAREPLLKPLPSIPAPENWTEEEERRRVFWTIFCLDRLCSVMTGWNTSLTSDDVQRRLPADGGLWHKEEAVATPYLGIWDRSVAKIGHSIAFLPGHYANANASVGARAAVSANADQGSEAAASTSTGPNTVDMTTVGAFAYCIEATESLSRVTTYFLRQKIDFENRQEVGSWLTRFKELDLRLVHWKMFLPQKWRDSNISRQPALIDMDPNLTLAHVTHNTSMVLLHQRIAYPESQWSNLARLPSFCSAETCQVAAVETSTITRKYLKYKPGHSPVTNQFVFCVFISARVLLIHWRHYGGCLDAEFWVLVESLDDMARRWAGRKVGGSSASPCLAERYASHLRELHRRCHSDPHFTVDVLGYSGPINASFTSPHAADPDLSGKCKGKVPGVSLNDQPTQIPFNDTMLDNVSSMPVPVPVPDFTPQETDVQGDELSAISHMLMDERFMSMERIISFDDNLFTAPENGGLAWQT